FSRVGAQGVVVFHDKDRLYAYGTRRIVPDDPRIALIFLADAARQIDFYRRTMAKLAIDFQMTRRLAYETVDLAESKSGALAAFLGRKERVDRPVHSRRVHSGSRVGDGDHHVLPFRQRLG